MLNKMHKTRQNPTIGLIGRVFPSAREELYSLSQEDINSISTIWFCWEYFNLWGLLRIIEFTGGLKTRHDKTSRLPSSSARSLDKHIS